MKLADNEQTWPPVCDPDKSEIDPPVSCKLAVTQSFCAGYFEHNLYEIY